MFAWKSPFSIGFDILFGVLPGMYLVFVCLVLLSTSELRDTTDTRASLIASSICITGLITSLGLIYVSLARGKTQPKPVFKIVLMVGISLAVFVPLMPFVLNVSNETDSAYGLIQFITAIEIPVVIVAIKHIFMLTRA